MGRETTRGAMNPREVGLEAYDLARAVAMTPEQALHTALDAAVEASHRSFIAGMREALLLAAEELDADDNNDIATDGPAAYIAFAMYLDETLPPELQKGY